MKTFPDILQGSDAWLALRAGKPTASRFADFITPARGDLGAGAAEYIYELLGECFVPGFQYVIPSRLMQRGTELEPEARTAFADYIGLQVAQVGFVLADDNITGCSPDGLVRADSGAWTAGLEIKCPTPKVHVKWHDAGTLPTEHKQQVHGSMVVTGLRVWHFWSYCPGMLPFHLEVQWDAYTDKVRESLATFVTNYKAARERLLPKISP